MLTTAISGIVNLDLLFLFLINRTRTFTGGKTLWRIIIYF